MTFEVFDLLVAGGMGAALLVSHPVVAVVRGRGAARRGEFTQQINMPASVHWCFTISACEGRLKGAVVRVEEQVVRVHESQLGQEFGRPGCEGVRRLLKVVVKSRHGCGMARNLGKVLRQRVSKHDYAVYVTERRGRCRYFSSTAQYISITNNTSAKAHLKSWNT